MILPHLKIPVMSKKRMWMLTAGNRVGTVKRTGVSAVEVWAECFGRDPAAIRRSDTYDIFGMLMKMTL